MDKAVIVLCKIEDCYDGNEGYESRKPLMPLFFKKLEQIAKINGADKLIFSFYTNKDFSEYYIKPTEIGINIKEEHKFIDLCKQFYKDENHEVIHSLPLGYNYKITKHENGVTMYSEISRFINESEENYDLKKVIVITNIEVPINDINVDIITTKGGFEKLIDSTDEYLKNKDVKKYMYA